MFDECHKAKNLSLDDTEQAKIGPGTRKDPKVSKTGVAVKEVSDGEANSEVTRQ